MNPDILTVNGVPYRILRLLGHGKGGYSYLAARADAPDARPVVLKQIHHEPCDYYTFGDKLAAEEHDYARLLQAGIRIPRLIDIDRTRERILKEYIDGPTAMELIEARRLPASALAAVRDMAALAEAAGLNIDYYPTNFVLSDDLLYYIDYECNDYMERWDFEHWGAEHWTAGPSK